MNECMGENFKALLPDYNCPDSAFLYKTATLESEIQQFRLRTKEQKLRHSSIIFYFLASISDLLHHKTVCVEVQV